MLHQKRRKWKDYFSEFFVKDLNMEKSEKNQEGQKSSQKTEHIKKVRRRIEDKLRNEMEDKEIEALGIILKVRIDTDE